MPNNTWGMSEISAILTHVPTGTQAQGAETIKFCPHPAVECVGLCNSREQGWPLARSSQNLATRHMLTSDLQTYKLTFGSLERFICATHSDWIA